MLAEVLRLLVQPAAAERLHEVRDRLPLDADVTREDVVPHGDGEGLDRQPALVEHERQRGAELPCVDDDLLLKLSLEQLRAGRRFAP